ncbi:MAG: hypothetical protein AB7P69_28930, partial [Candidatus Binatia bacterium]
MRSEKSNKWKYVGFWSLVLAGVMIVPALTKASESPLATIRTTVERSMAVLKDPTYQGNANFQKRIAKIEEIVLPRLDSVEFGRRCLGVH